MKLSLWKFRGFIYLIGFIIMLLLVTRKAYCFWDVHIPNKEEICKHVREDMEEESRKEIEQIQDIVKNLVDQKDWCDRNAGHLTNRDRDRD